MCEDLLAEWQNLSEQFDVQSERDRERGRQRKLVSVTELMQQERRLAFVATFEKERRIWCGEFIVQGYGEGPYLSAGNLRRITWLSFGGLKYHVYMLKMDARRTSIYRSPA